MMVATHLPEAGARRRNGFRNVRSGRAAWIRAVPADPWAPLFPFPPSHLALCRRIAVEKTSRRFSKLDLPGTEGDHRRWPRPLEPCPRLSRRSFLGPKSGEELVRHYAAAMFFVFPSLTDTFGLVMLEAAGMRGSRGRLPRAGADRRAGRCTDRRSRLRSRPGLPKALEIPRLAARALQSPGPCAIATEQFLSIFLSGSRLGGGSRISHARTPVLSAAASPSRFAPCREFFRTACAPGIRPRGPMGAER